MKTMITLKADTVIKRQAQELAENMGLTLSSLLNAFLHQFVAKRSFDLSVDLEPSPYLEKIIEQAEKDIKNRKHNCDDKNDQNGESENIQNT